MNNDRHTKKQGVRTGGAERPETPPKKPSKKRLDALVVEKQLAESRGRAQALIMAGNILVDDTPVDKPGAFVRAGAVITSRAEDLKFVSRGGLKLEHALDVFSVDVAGAKCLDVGASTGGFTDCLLQRGAKSVCAVDVGYGQLAWKLRNDGRVHVIERKNIRYMTAEDLPAPFDIVTIDVSFISLKIVVPVVRTFLKPAGQILALVKPQFEVGKDQVGKGGVVRDSALHDAVTEGLASFFHEKCRLESMGITPSPISGPKGNREFIMLLGRAAG